MLYMGTFTIFYHKYFTINIPQMLAYIPAPWIRHGYYKPMGLTWFNPGI